MYLRIVGFLSKDNTKSSRREPRKGGMQVFHAMVYGCRHLRVGEVNVDRHGKR